MDKYLLISITIIGNGTQLNALYSILPLSLSSSGPLQNMYEKKKPPKSNG